MDVTPSSGGTAAQATDAVRTSSQQAGIDRPTPTAGRTKHVAVPGRHYEHGANLTRPARSPPYRRNSDTDPLYRPLKVFTSDPARSDFDGAVAVVSVPYETLAPGPTGARLAVVADRIEGVPEAAALDLEHPGVLIGQGLTPAPGDLRFHRQMTYAVASTVIRSFAVALGREPSWGFERRGGQDRLLLRPHSGRERNACYDKASGELRFGWFEADGCADAAAAVPPGGRVYTCLSHDIIAHEMTHALLDGMRSRFMEPTNPDVLAFHEAFADIVAVLHQFSHRVGVVGAIVRGKGRLDGGVVFALAEQFGRATGCSGPLRAWLDRRGAVQRYDPAAGSHELGSVLVGAVLEALSVAFERRVARLRALYALANMPAAHLHPDYRDLLAEAAAKVAGQFLALCIRAIDYCPPVDVTFGEYLRALVTADRDLVEDDVHGYREALIGAFGRRGIFPAHVPDLSEASLLWHKPSPPLPRIEALDLAHLRLADDPGHAPPEREIERQAGALADVVTDPRHADEFGLDVSPGRPLPVVESIRTIRRVGPDRQVRLGLVAEVVQAGRDPGLYGGATVILGGAGDIRYVVRKRVGDRDRARRTAEYQATPAGRAARDAVATGRICRAVAGAGRDGRGGSRRG